MSNTVIKVENVSKLYRLGQVGTGTITHDINRWWAKVRGKEDPFAKIGETNDRTKKGKGDYVWSLKDINFEIKQGEAVGIIGRNGAGKSTLLKLLSKVTAPTTGRINVKGRIASLLEVGTGFHPELTGRENIFLNGAILGMRKEEIKRKFDKIVDFSGVERYIDTPVKRYSSGMYVRLAFAVAAHLESEILIVDEVLAVGDAEFQKKCLGKMGDVTRGEGRTVLFVSHNMAAIKNLCTKGILMRQGRIELADSTLNCINKYTSENITNVELNENELIFKQKRGGNGKVKFLNFYLENEYGKRVNTVLTGESVVFVFKLIVLDETVKNIDIGFSFHNSYSEVQSYLYSSFQNQYYSPNGSGIIEVKCHLKNFPFTEKKISVKGRIVADGNESDWPNEILGIINIEQGDFYGTGKITENLAPFLIQGIWK